MLRRWQATPCRDPGTGDAPCSSVLKINIQSLQDVVVMWTLGATWTAVGWDVFSTVKQSCCSFSTEHMLSSVAVCMLQPDGSSSMALQCPRGGSCSKNA